MKLPKVYEPKAYEEDIYALWEKSEAFKPVGGGPSYSLVVPPPNANGDLHMGQALTLALEDIAVRYHRLKDDRVLFVPGADHAGFETWVVYERLLASKGKSRFDYSREELYKQVWDFVATNRENFEKQFRRLGASVDWQHFTFTLDDKIVKRAYATFKKMWDEGLIYRGERLVNFCTFHGTSFADIEVEFKTEKGKLWYIRYPLSDGTGEILVSTTRPETMLGDTGVAVNPDDPRYHAFVGKTVRLPLTGREVPIVTDSFVDKAFGTGAVKLTPAHDQNDFEAGKRHNLPLITVITHEGKMADNVPEDYRGLSIKAARDKVVEDLTSQGLITKVEEISHSVGHCYKCDTVIEPLLRDQWFIDVQPLAKRAIEALRTEDITFYPESKKDLLITYLSKVQDWNISRQIAWGIPIPAFWNIDKPDDWIYDERIDNETIEVNGKTYRRDPDVFDTWFSSSSWPYATLDFPDGQDFKDFYPLSVMETCFDILHQWVARMLMMGLYVTDKIPFESVYLHGMVLDSHGQKMSKSKGNVVNPMNFIDKYGSDALRMGVVSGQTAGSSQPFSEPKVLAARNFCNKLWNIARYVEANLGEDFKEQPHPVPRTIADHWILSQLQQAEETISGHLDNYRFGEAYNVLYHFVWDDFADWYIECSKVSLNINVLVAILEATLKLAHPFAPFITETIWQTFAWEATPLALAKWPEPILSIPQAAQEFETIKSIVAETRYFISSMGLTTTKLHYIAPEFVKNNAGLIEKLTHVKTVTEVQMSPGLRLINNPYQCWLDVDNKQLERYIQELRVKLEAQRKIVFHFEGRLTNTSYLAKAPPELVEQTKSQSLEAQTTLATLAQELERFEPHDITKPTQIKPGQAETDQPAPETTPPVPKPV
jgi:valyl-tRNA synthetase